jgi:hypothetical protein
MTAGEIFYGSRRYEVEALSERGVSSKPDERAPRSLSRNAGGTFPRSKSAPDPKPEKRIVDGTAEPLDRTPIDENYCPLTGKFTVEWHRHHVVSRAQGGSDVPENLVWVSPEAHDALHRGERWAREALVRYCRETVPEYGQYADAAKYEGWLEARWGA